MSGAGDSAHGTARTITVIPHREGRQDHAERKHPQLTVPVAVEGWAKIHQRFGKLRWKDLFQAAIAKGEEGFPVAEVMQGAWQTPGLREEAAIPQESARVCLPGGKAPEISANFFDNPDLARAIWVAGPGRVCRHHRVYVSLRRS